MENLTRRKRKRSIRNNGIREKDADAGEVKLEERRKEQIKD